MMQKMWTILDTTFVVLVIRSTSKQNHKFLANNENLEMKEEKVPAEKQRDKELACASVPRFLSCSDLVVGTADKIPTSLQEPQRESQTKKRKSLNQKKELELQEKHHARSKSKREKKGTRNTEKAKMETDREREKVVGWAEKYGKAQQHTVSKIIPKDVDWLCIRQYRIQTL